MSKIEFSIVELLAKGFNLEEDGGVFYATFIFNKKDYINSKFLATEDFNNGDNPFKLGKEWFVDASITTKVINNIDPDNGEAYLTEEQIDELIERGGF